MQENSRKRLYDVYKAIIHLRKSHEAFTGDDFTYSLNQAVKILKLNDPNMNAVVLANFDVENKDKQLAFQHQGWWYEYFSGDSINVTGNYNFTLGPGEYRVYTDQKLDIPNVLNTTDIIELAETDWNIKLYPNPAIDIVHVQLSDITLNEKLVISLMDANGKLVIQKEMDPNNELSIPLHNLSKGHYQFIVQQGHKIDHKGFLKN